MSYTVPFKSHLDKHEFCDFVFMENSFIMNKIVKMNGYVYLVEGWDKKGFETYYNLGKDPDDPKWKDEDETPKQNKNKKRE